MIRREPRKINCWLKKHRSLSLLALVCLGVLMLSGGAWANNAPAEIAADDLKKMTEEQVTLSQSDTFIYQRGNRSDPFVPFISEERTTTKQIDSEELLTGMRLFEPGQLNLVAISSGGNKPLALVQDSTGKGYILKEGIAIGRRGIITSIITNSVIIEESFLTSSGEQKTRSIKMVLRKEGEK
nr:pilus assembly protein PilP [Desulfobulbaceae bacterium]